MNESFSIPDGGSVRNFYQAGEWCMEGWLWSKPYSWAFRKWVSFTLVPPSFSTALVLPLVAVLLHVAPLWTASTRMPAVWCRWTMLQFVELQNLASWNKARVIIISKTCVNRTILDSEILLQHYLIHRKDHEEIVHGQRGGGDLEAIDCSVQCMPRSDLEP